MAGNNLRSYISAIQKRRPAAIAEVKGDAAHPQINGTVYFFKVDMETLLIADISGLPTQPGTCAAGVFGFHIHEGGACAGDETDPFSQTGGHFNPHGCQHPHHAGDLPPLFENGGHAFMAFASGRFAVSDVLGRTVVIHGGTDDFTTQPSGNSGAKIACGVIHKA